MIRVFTDGGARGNPGPAAFGIYIENDKGILVYRLGQAIGIATNNVAEYKGVIAALSYLGENKAVVSSHKTIEFFLDSLLLVSQINGLYKVKSPHLQELFALVRQKEAQIAIPVCYFHIPREKNKKADALVNWALDGKGKT